MTKDKHKERCNYQSCFGSDTGPGVLTQILIDAGYFDHNLKTIEELAVLNFVKGAILVPLGIHPRMEDVEGKKKDKARSYVNQILNMPIGD